MTICYRRLMEKRGLKWAIEYYSDEQVCIDAVANMRWPDGPQCPHAVCGAKEPYYLATQKRFKCRKCRKQFSVKVGTIFEDSPIPLQKWLPAMWMLANCKNGVSSHEIGRALGVTQKSAWFMLHRLRLAMKDNAGTKLGGNDGGAVEVDESFFGGKVKNMHRDKRARYAAEKGHVGGATGKTAVIGMLDRETREIRTKVIPDVKRDTLQEQILKNVKFGSNVYTDDAVPYNRLNWHYVHEVVNHANEYVRGQVHTNGLENFWSLFKRHLRGTYVAVEPFHLDRYLDEQVFRFNNRKKPMNDYERFQKVLAQVAHKRLTYAELTGKTDDARTATQATEPF
jgi:transposase-like protein